MLSTGSIETLCSKSSQRHLYSFSPAFAKTMIIALLLLSLIPSSFAESPQPIHFEKGSISSSVQGIIPAHSNKTWYQFKAKQGQYALINIRSYKNIPEIANVGILQMPSGQQDGSKGGIVYQGCLPEAGLYKLRIARNLMATNGGKAGYDAEIVILPKYASQPLCD